MAKIKNLVLGGGISGLAFSNYQQTATNCVIIEQDLRAGGLCKSHTVGESVFDYSGHFLHYDGHEELKDELGLTDM